MALTKIKLLRLQRGLRQWDVARQVGVSETKLSRIETGRDRPTAVVATRLATVLGLTPEALLEEVEVPDDAHHPAYTI